MRLISLFLCLLLFQTACHATLLEDVDSLSPTQSVLLQKKLASKLIYPFPENLISQLGFHIGTFAQSTSIANMDRLGASNFRVLQGIVGAVKYYFSPSLCMGVEFASGKRDIISQTLTTSSVFTQNTYQMGYTHGILEWAVYRESNLQLKLNFGAGITSTDMDLITYDEGSSGYAKFVKRSGSTFSYSAGFETDYFFNPIWSIGLGIHYLNANIKQLTNRVGVQTTGEPGIDYSGVTVRVLTGIQI